MATDPSNSTARIVRSLGGFYTLRYPDGGRLECRARGVFRKEGITPLVGDFARAELQADGSGYVTELLPRTNRLLRPPIANVDLLLLIASAAQPRPDLELLDFLLAAACAAEVPVLLVITKADLDGAYAEMLRQVYTSAGYEAMRISMAEAAGLAALRERLAGKFAAVCGNTGVGKSTLLNRLEPGLQLTTGETSEKLGRGRHTTRHCEVYTVGDALIADTPGFWTFDRFDEAGLTAANLGEYYPEIQALTAQCRYDGCTHTREDGCAVRCAAQSGEIAKSRYASYLSLYEKLKDIRPWKTSKRMY
ncbi:MAG: ribosome small subunit-dependent GTPase A [Oscillospiraceae bacterium]|nr:ribosome small subunit-dependent GTPase A [Oscillospiraceae bacterium]